MEAPSPNSWSFQRDGVKLSPGGPFVLEVCGGSCRLTAAFRSRGFDAWGIDHKGGKLIPETPALLFFDLTLESDVRSLKRLLTHPQLAFVHFSPPCGTCSRARDRALPGAADGGPPPLRSEAFPLGFPDLDERLPHLLPRVQAANRIYAATFELIGVLQARSVAWSVENPRNSFLWHIPFVDAVLKGSGVEEVQFQHCMFGSARNKWTSIWFSPPGLLSGLRRQCDGSHAHEPWGLVPGRGFSTALETVYPHELCQQIVSEVSKHIGFKPAAARPVVKARGPPAAARPRAERIAAGFQPRGPKARRLIPEFRTTLVVPGAFEASAPGAGLGTVGPLDVPPTC